jgi:hypothetical protein
LSLVHITYDFVSDWNLFNFTEKFNSAGISLIDIKKIGSVLGSAWMEVERLHKSACIGGVGHKSGAIGRSTFSDEKVGAWK